MSTTAFLSKLFNINGGVLPMKKKSSRGVVMNKAFDRAYRTKAAVAHNKRTRRLHKKSRKVKQLPKPVDTDQLLADILSGVHTSARSQNAYNKGLPPRRSGRARTQPERWSPTAAAKTDQENAKKVRKSTKSTKSTSAAKSHNSPRRSPMAMSRSPSPLPFDFMKLRL